MKLNLISLAKIYILVFGFLHFGHVISFLGILGINETMVNAPPYLTFWWWHVILFLVYGVLPIITVSIDNEKSYLILTGVSLVGILVEAFRVFTWAMDFYFILALLDSLAAILSIILAVEKVASEASAEILSLGWSQF